MLPNLASEQLLRLYRRMLLIRRFEEALILLSSRGHSFGHFHVYIGQEVTGTFALALLGPDDTIFTTHRNHGHLLARGADPGRLLAEIMGKATGYNKGKGGTLHTSVRELGFPLTSAIVGGVLPLAIGTAFAQKQRSAGQVTLCCFGDGALEEGASFESLNMAALWSLPVIFLCENNSLEASGQKAGEYPSSTIAAAELTDLARSFRVPAVSLDGTDAGAVQGAVSDALQRARQRQGPTFIEARTVRWPGSRPIWPTLLTGETDLAMAWDGGRIPEAHGVWHRRQDGLLGFTRELIEARLATPDGLLAIDAQVRAELERAIEFALNSPYPAPESATDGVFA